MRTISATVDIDAPPDQVWGVLADLDAYPDWNPFIQSASGRLAEGKPSPCGWSRRRAGR
jgi:uncharacterized protein YndB with AHSA1/START domain